MNKLVNISQLAKITGLSVTTIRRRVANRSIPYTRANTNTQAGKLLFDVELVQQLIRNEIYSNLKGCSMDEPAQEPKAEPTSYLASLFQPSSDAVEAAAEQNSNFGYPPRNGNTSSSSFSK